MDTRIKLIASEWVTGRALKRAMFDAGVSCAGKALPQTFGYTKHGTDLRHESERVITITVTAEED